MKTPTVVTQNEWLEARQEHLVKEKEFNRLRDELSESRRQLPWVKVEQSYRFETQIGAQSLAELFEGNSQLIVYHFMYGPDWEDACPSCSLWADNFNGIDIHLSHRDITLIAVSRAPLDVLLQYRERMGCDFKWVSSINSQFNYDYQASFTLEEIEKGDVYYNYRMTNFPANEAPGISVFYKNDEGEIFHTYSTYARGLDMLNGAYHYMDLVPKGRDEDPQNTMSWLRRRDQYDN